MRALPHKYRVCAVHFPRLPSMLHACVLGLHNLLILMLYVLCLTNIEFVAFPLAPFKFARVRSWLVQFSDVFVMRALPHKRRFCAVLFPLDFGKVCTVVLGL